MNRFTNSFLRVLLTLVLAGFVVRAMAATPPEPVVAIHVSEYTAALENMAAVAPTPMGPGTTGKQWFMTAWKYFVASESLKTAFTADGTPFVVVTDAQIATNHLLQADGSPRYPILFSLANEAVADNQITPLRNYVSAGGFLFVGSSSFTRNTNGTARTNFALASEMGINKVFTSLTNWGTNLNFTKVGDHRLLSHIPAGTVKWRMPLHAEELSMGISPSNAPVGLHWVWRVNTNGGAQALAGGSLGPLLATKPYGQGRFIYHSAMQPLVAHGAFEVGMFAYVIYREAVEWAFEAANLPMARVSPWRYQHDAAFIVRHDFETFKDMISQIEASAAFEKANGARGEYYFCTGYLRDQMTNKTATIASLRRALTNSGALFGSHNGGLRHPVNTNLSPVGFDVSSGVPNSYWHWGTDEALNVTPPGYASGKAYAQQSVLISFQDYETWFAGLNYGPRIWAAPAFNSTREDSFELLQNLGVITVGEQKISPFPHWTMSKQSPGKRYAHLTVPMSEWFNASGDVIQAMDDHTSATMRAAADFYYNLGALINLYGHFPSLSGTVQGEYVTYAAAKPRIWSTTSVDLYDWSLALSNVIATSTFSRTGGTGIVHTAVLGAVDTNTTIEVAIPNWTTNKLPTVQVLFNGAAAPGSSYRATPAGVKARVGTAVTNLQLRYPSPQDITLWSNGSEPAVASSTDLVASEVGLKFQSYVAGNVTAIRFYKGAGNTGTHIGHLWTTNGTLLATTVFTNETATGWQQQSLTNPVPIASNTTYIVSYYAPNGRYAIDEWYFQNGGFTNHPLRALRNGEQGGNGVGRDGMGFPTNSYNAANSWVDLVFQPAANLSAINLDVTLLEDTATNLTLSGAGSGGALTYAILTNPTNGALGTLNTNTGGVAYTPNMNQVGPDTFRFTVREGSLLATGSVSLVINAVNDAPILGVASNNVVRLEDSGAVTISAYATMTTGPANESAQAVTNVAVWSVSNTTLFAVAPAVSTNGTLTFTPAANSNGVAAVTIQARDSGGTANGGTNGSAWLTFTITINAVNDAPSLGVASNTIVVLEDPGAVTVSGYATMMTGPANESSQSISNVVVLNVSNVALFAVSPAITTNGTLTFTPAAGSHGVAAVTIQARDNGGSANGGTNGSLGVVFNIVVTPVNDTPVAFSQSATNAEDTPFAITLTGSDVDGPLTNYVVLTQPQFGDLSGDPPDLTYTGTNNYSGPDSFTFSVNDGSLTSSVATVTLTLTNLNDTPVANNQFVTALEDTLTNIVLTATDIDGDDLAFAILESPANGVLGALNETSGAMGYAPNANYNGVDVLTFTVSDGSLLSTGVVTITVIAVNDTPVADSQSVTNAEDTLFAVTLTGSDVDGPVTNFIVLTQPALGFLSGDLPNLTYTGTNNHSGPDSFTFSVNDGSLTSAVATVTITLTNVNDAPFAADQFVATREDTLTNIVLTAADVDSSGLTFAMLAGPTNGSLGTVNTETGVISYTPATNYNGDDAFVFIVSDGLLLSTGVVSIAVIPVNDAPQFVATPADVQMAELDSVTITNRATDVDVPAQALSYQLLNPPAGAAIDANGVITWTPNITQGTSTNEIVTAVSDGLSSATNVFVVKVLSLVVAPEYLSISVSGNVATITWSSQVGEEYEVQHLDGPGYTNWIPLSPRVLAVGSTASATHDLGGAASRFYRVMVVTE